MDDILRISNTEERRRKLDHLKRVDPAAYREIVRELVALGDAIERRERARPVGAGSTR